MTQWKDRPSEVAYSFNPAFCGETIRACVAEYVEAGGRAMPYPLCHLILPIVLHKRTREMLPPTRRRRMHAWLIENQDAKIGFGQRVHSMIPFTREALAFLISQGAARVTSAGGIHTGRKTKATGCRPRHSGEVLSCVKGAKIVGRWFEAAGEPPTIFRMWGVRP